MRHGGDLHEEPVVRRIGRHVIDHRPERTARDVVYGIGSVAVGVGLIFYGRYFLKKLKDVGYL